MTTDTVHNEGADLVYDREGDGPVLLLISGGGGEAARYAQIAELLHRRQLRPQREFTQHRRRRGPGHGPAGT